MGQNNIARGSEWRKWDFQVHTPASHLNNQFGSDWDVYVQNLFRAAIAKDISAIGLTDYFTIDGYKKVKEEYLSQPAKLASLFTADEIDRISKILVFPNIEFRLSRFVGPNRINCHVILSEDLSPRTIEEHFLHDLTFTNKADPQQAAEKHKLKVENLRDFGERLKSEHAAFAEHDSLFVGMMNAVVDDDDIVRALQDGRFKDKFFFCVVADEDLSKVKWDGQDHHARKILIQRSSALFASNPATRAWALGRPPYGEGEDAFIREFKTLKPCLHGSDCHGYPEIGHPCAKKGKSGHDCSTQSDQCDLRYCWIKADTTFEGLRQILHEPGDRTFIGPTAPDYHDEARVIRSVSLSDGKGWFDAEIKNIVEVEAPKLSDMRSRRLQAYVAYFENRTQEQVALGSLYEPIRDQLAEQALLKGKELDFIIKWSANLGNWLERGSALFDQRRTIPYSTFDKLGQEARRLLVPAWTSGDPARISAAFDEFMGEFRKPDLEWQSYARSGVTFQDILSWLYEVDHIQLDYGLKFNGADLESLSPGTKGIVLLILYLGMDTNDTRPLIVDQPDENLDNESIYTLLTPYFRLAKVRRQIIVITHNPNLVVNSDSEQVIIAHADKQPNGLPTISYVAGGLEDDRPTKGIRHQVCSILEGGNDAFRKRERRYALAQ